MNINKLIKQSIRGNRRKEKELYMLLAKDLYGLCKRYSVDDHQAKDYMQEGFVRIFEKLHLYDPDKANLLTWSKKVVVNTILSLKRKKSVSIHYTEFIFDTFQNEDESNPFDQEENKIVELIKQLRLLPDHYQQVLNLYLFEGWTHHEIAVQLNIKQGTSRSLLSRGKLLLKNKVNQQINIHESQTT